MLFPNIIERNFKVNCDHNVKLIAITTECVKYLQHVYKHTKLGGQVSLGKLMLCHFTELQSLYIPFIDIKDNILVIAAVTAPCLIVLF